MDETLARDLRAATRRTRVSMIVVGIGTAALGAFMAAGPFLGVDPTLTAAARVGLVLFGVVFLLTAAALLYVGLRPDPLLGELSRDPARVVWVYGAPVVHGKRQTGVNVIVCLADGRRFPLMFGTAAGEAMVARLGAALPHARVGFTPELHRAFATNPASFMASASRG